MSQKSRSRSPTAGDSQASCGSKLTDTTGAAADDETSTFIAASKSTDEFPLVKPSEVDKACRVEAEQALTWVLTGTFGAAADDETLTFSAARKSTDEVPSVKPSEVDEASRVEAEQALTWVRRNRLLPGTQLSCFVNPCGYITNVSTVTYSRIGVAMLSFRLQHGSGRYVPCCAHGRYAENGVIEEKASVVIFFASASASIGQSLGMLWLYDDCYVVVKRRNCIVPPATQAIYIGDAPAAFPRD